MKSYKDFPKVFIGYSNIGSLIAKAPGKVQDIYFGGDGSYEAYIVNEPASIGAHYEKVFDCSGWLKIYDDESLTLTLKGEQIIIYRAGEFGCIIEVKK